MNKPKPSAKKARPESSKNSARVAVGGYKNGGSVKTKKK